MFQRAEFLLDDIDQLADTQVFPPASSSLSSSEVGQSVIMLALGRMPTAYQGLATDDIVSDLRQQTARQLVARWFLGNEATLYASLGVAPDCSHEMLRENYRRLIGLVHPDTRPVGFPEDSASRVNMAYGVLADGERRASYDASMALLTQQTPSPLQAAATISPVRARASQSDGIIDRFRAAVPQVRFGNGLLAISGLMLLPIGYAVYSLANRDVQPQIVEARTKLRNSAEIKSLSEESSGTPTAQPAPGAALSDNAQAAANTATGQRSSPTLKEDRRSVTSVEPSPTLTFSTRLQNLIGGSSQSASAPVEAPARVQNPTVSLMPVRPSTDSAAPAQSAQPLLPEATGSTRAASTNTAPIAAASGAAERTAVKSPSPALSADGTGALVNADRAVRAPVPPQVLAAQSGAAPILATETRVSTGDADDILVKLSGAYEAGSITAFNKVFATSMAGRRQLLSDYERVFQQTRQRSIRFTQFKHKVNGEKLLTSGFAVVSTVDNDNRASSQRIFLEIDIGRDPEGLKIERLQNYPLN